MSPTAVKQKSRVPSARKHTESIPASTHAADLAANSRLFLSETAESVREELQASESLTDFLTTAGTLTLKERKLLVDQALLLFEQHYVHLPLKVAMHGINPVQKLRLVRGRLERATELVPEWQFHSDMLEIFHSVRDLHTNYLLPAPFNKKVAYLPFLIEEFVENGKKTYVVSAKVAGFTAPGFGPGAIVTHWNGTPFGRAVDLQANRYAGSNAAARHSRGLQSMTIRPLRVHLPPDEDWITLGYLGTDGTEHELQQNWLVTENLPTMVADVDSASSPAALAMGLDLDADEVNRARKLLFAPAVVAQEKSKSATGAMPPGSMKTVTTDSGQEFPTNTPGVFRARSVQTTSGTFGHIRIFTFSVEDPVAFVTEFVRLLSVIPQNGLILDVRGNGGGHIYASEFSLQTLTPRTIVPEPVQFISTPQNLALCRGHAQDGFGDWLPSLEQALETGSVFSSSFPITPTDGANAVGQQYSGPVVLITDARCYSATDIFAAGFADHKIGTILGVDNNTGAGGANVWTHALIKDLYENPGPGGPAAGPSPYKDLPKGANMRVSIRRTLRVGDLTGTPVEDLGVVPDEVHPLTRNDVLAGNVDLLNRAGEILQSKPVHTIGGTAVPGGASLTLDLQVAGIDRIDVYVDDRPRSTVDVVDGPVTVMVADVVSGQAQVKGYSAGELVVSRRFDF